MTDPSSSSCGDENACQYIHDGEGQKPSPKRNTHKCLVPSVIELELEISTFRSLREDEGLKILLRDDMPAGEVGEAIGFDLREKLEMEVADLGTKNHEKVSERRNGSRLEETRLTGSIVPPASTTLRTSSTTSLK